MYISDVTITIAFQWQHNYFYSIYIRWLLELTPIRMVDLDIYHLFLHDKTNFLNLITNILLKCKKNTEWITSINITLVEFKHRLNVFILLQNVTFYALWKIFYILLRLNIIIKIVLSQIIIKLIFPSRYIFKTIDYFWHVSKKNVSFQKNEY